MTATVTRQTKETTVKVVLSVGEGASRIDTGLKFFDHMLGTLARYAGFVVELHARGDLRHHLMEDVALALGEAVARVTPATAARFGERTICMDDALVQAVLDVGGRPYFAGKLHSQLYTHVFRSFAQSAGLCLHLRVLRGSDRHHRLEAAFKATGLALRDALRDGGVVFSTKGSVKLEVS